MNPSQVGTAHVSGCSQEPGPSGLCSTRHGRTRPAGPLDVPADRQGAGRAVHRRPATSSTWSAAACATWCSATRRARPRLHHERAPHRDHARPPRLGRAPLPGRRAFGTVGALKDGQRLEITTFRQEVYAEEHRKPSVTFGDDLETDLSRRDFTINAMAIRLPDGVFVDPLRRDPPPGRARARHAAGPRDVASPTTRCAWCAPRGSSPSSTSTRPPGWSRRCDAMRERLRDRLGRAHPRRARQAAGERASGQRACSSSSRRGVADLFLPELADLQLEQDPVHRHKDVLHHTYAVVERTEPDLTLRLAALLHDIGKPATRQITPDGRAVPSP